jgi:hypothetical protein
MPHLIYLSGRVELNLKESQERAAKKKNEVGPPIAEKRYHPDVFQIIALQQEFQAMQGPSPDARSVRA